MQTLEQHAQPMRELTSSEIDAVSGAWSIGSSGDGGISFEIGGYFGTIWSDGAALGSTSGNVTTVRFYNW